ncbi:uncharacterized protein zgc:153345 [Osmerus mordax]|uniref:uncharacterized protein zgc:153345 n=1 Tax=Osmerus mordax TaxID=8014 RepID=UPI00350FCB39
MHSPAEDRSRVVAVINTLKTAGIRVKNWKNYLNGASLNNSLRKESQLKFAFGRDLSLVPQCDVKDVGGTVPKFLVDACGFLSHHLHTEGLFRKTGSLNRIRALRGGLEQGEPVFSQPYSATLQPCDVASLLKQFLRELPSPLIPVDLQAPLCHAQSLEEGQEGARDEATLLITALFPAVHTRALQYFCIFLRKTADRCDENRMEAGNLALVMAPNLLQSPAGGSKLTVGTERLLDRQAAVIKVLIAHADRIGVIPPCLLSMSPLSEGGEATPPSDGGKFQQRGVGVYRSLKRQRRRSVGEIFVDALSKLKTGFNPSTGSSNPADSQQNSRPTPQSPVTVKRKCTEDPVPEVEGSAKKRRSVQDLRESQSCNLSNVLSEVDPSEKQDACVTLRTSEEKKNPNKDSKLLNRPEVEEDCSQRRRSLRFFNTASWNLPNTTSTLPQSDHETVMPGSKMLSDDAGGVSICKAENTSRIPVILIDGPGRAVRENEVEDDPDLLNLSFMEDPTAAQDTPDSPTGTEGAERQGEVASPGGEDMEVLDSQNDSNRELGGVAKTEVNHGDGSPDEQTVREKVSGRASRKRRAPRRSISLPDVNLEHLRDEDESLEEDEGERCLSVSREDQELPDSGRTNAEGDRPTTSEDTASRTRNERAALKREHAPEKPVESGSGFKRSRMSVADHLRRFNALATLLRTPRAPPPPAPAPLLRDRLHETLLGREHRGSLGLRRQGARRFGRSISHDGVPGAPAGLGREADRPGGASPGPLVQSALPEPTGRPEAFRLELDPETHRLPGATRLENVPRPGGSPSAAAELPEQSQGCREEVGEFQPEEPSDKPELHHLLQEQLTLCDSDRVEGGDLTAPVQLDRQTQTEVTSARRRQSASPVGKNFQVREVQPRLPTAPSLHLHMHTCCVHINTATQTDSATPPESYGTANTEAECPPGDAPAFDFVAVDMDGCSLEASPPALTFRPTATRRRYRDSPRWLVHEVSMAAGESLQI